jgi:F-type H+-transporting ATPase subunit gamma
MATLRDIKARIKTVANIKKITRAMQLVAAAKLNRAQERAQTVRPYAEELNGILATLAMLSGEDAVTRETPMEISISGEGPPVSTTREMFFAQTEEKRPGLVLLTSDRGLCGAFNTQLTRAAQAFLKERRDADTRLITLGRKGRAFFKTRKIDSLYHREGISDRLLLPEIKEITGRLVDLYVTGEVDSLYLIFAKLRKALSYDITVQKFLSIPPVEQSGGEEVYILEPDRDRVFEALIPLYATTTIFSALADSYASEYGARMVAMQQATTNAEEKMNDLIILRNRLRQATITKELAEIVGGAEALK